LQCFVGVSVQDSTTIVLPPKHRFVCCVSEGVYKTTN
jgi:hypothetical protein